VYNGSCKIKERGHSAIVRRAHFRLEAPDQGGLALMLPEGLIAALIAGTATGGQDSSVPHGGSDGPAVHAGTEEPRGSESHPIRVRATWPRTIVSPSAIDPFRSTATLGVTSQALACPSKSRPLSTGSGTAAPHQELVQPHCSDMCECTPSQRPLDWHMLFPPDGYLSAQGAHRNSGLDFPGVQQNALRGRSHPISRIFTDTHSGTRNPLRVVGWEEWEPDADLKVKASRGGFDADDYARQTAAEGTIAWPQNAGAPWSATALQSGHRNRMKLPLNLRQRGASTFGQIG
jgi:hypothetical protein